MTGTHGIHISKLLSGRGYFCRCTCIRWVDFHVLLYFVPSIGVVDVYINNSIDGCFCISTLKLVVLPYIFNDRYYNLPESIILLMVKYVIALKPDCLQYPLFIIYNAIMCYLVDNNYVLCSLLYYCSCFVNYIFFIFASWFIVLSCRLLALTVVVY